MHDVAIIGVGLHPFGRFEGKTAMQMGVDAIAAALERPFDPTELEHRDVTLTCTASWLSDARLRLNVSAIEPAWRVSEAELERARILDGLRRAGLLEAQRRLSSPAHLERVSVLHPPGQGWDDVAATLQALAAAGILQVDDLECRFDGPGAVPALIRRLDEAAALHRGREDRGLVLLVRGGGSPAGALGAREVAALFDGILAHALRAARRQRS